MTCRPVREAVGVLQNESSLRVAVDEGLMPGFDRPAISIFAERRRIERQTRAAADRGVAWACMSGRRDPMA